MVKYFINCGLDVKATDQQGATVLHYAAERNLELASFLGHMAPSLLNVRDNHGRTPLVRAMMMNFSQTAQIIKLVSNTKALSDANIIRNTKANNIKK